MTSIDEWFMQELNEKEKKAYLDFKAHTKKHWEEFGKEVTIWKKTAKKDEKTGLTIIDNYPRVPGGIDGSDTTYRITPGGIGTSYVLICNVKGCGREDNITDVSCW